MHQDEQVLIESDDTQIYGLKVFTTSNNTVPSRTLAVVNVQIDMKKVHKGHIYDVQPNQAHTDTHLNMVLMPTMYKVDNVLLKLLVHSSIYVPRSCT